MPDGVTAFSEPYCKLHDIYQTYYRNSIAAYCASAGIPFREVGSRFPHQLRTLRRIRHSARFQSAVPGGTKIVDGLAKMLGAAQGKTEHVIGSYIFNQDGVEIKICIDAQDTRLLIKPDLLEWCDVYFKANYWPTEVYPAKVVPIANVNPACLDKIGLLKSCRHQKKELDLFVSFRVWGGTDELEGVEHGLALIEALAKVKCRKKVLAYLLAGDISAAVKRLESAGVAWTTKWIPQAELWGYAAKSRLNIVRHGMHQCVPWRMAEILAMGGCPVMDYEATTRWHVPLVEGQHYVHLNLPYQPNEAGRIDTKTLTDRVESWVRSEELTESISRNTERYFDEHLTPAALGKYILDYATSRVVTPSPSSAPASSVATRDPLR
jgi:hypothetical protein